MGVGMRIRGASERFSGRVKTLIGRATDDPELIASGTASRVGGSVRLGFARTLGWTRGAVQAGLGAVLRGAGKATRSRDMQAAGVVKGVEGEARKVVNQ
jgi:uncharacterized protein YjbJ (UPF0337 family)